MRAVLGLEKELPREGIQMYRPTLLERFCLPFVSDRRRRRQFTAAVLPLEDRRLLSTSAVMTQTATFPNIQSLPNVSDRAILYFNSNMGTLTEVEVVTSGLFTAQFGSGGTSVKVNSSSSTLQTTPLTDSADLAAFTGNFRIPISVTTSSSAGEGDPSATIKVIYHFIPNLPSLDSPSSPGSGPLASNASSSTNGVGTSGTTSSSTISGSSTGTPSPTSSIQGTTHLVATGSTKNGLSPGHPKKNVSVRNRTPLHPVVHHLLVRHPRPAVEHLRATKAHVAHP